MFLHLNDSFPINRRAIRGGLERTAARYGGASLGDDRPLPEARCGTIGLQPSEQETGRMGRGYGKDRVMRARGAITVELHKDQIMSGNIFSLTNPRNCAIINKSPVERAPQERRQKPHQSVEIGESRSSARGCRGG